MIRGRRYKAGLQGVANLRQRVRVNGLTYEEAGAECVPKYSRQCAHGAIRYFEQRFNLKPTDPNPEEFQPKKDAGGTANHHLPPSEPKPADTPEEYRSDHEESRTPVAQ